jgi:hypothetical protein
MHANPHRVVHPRDCLNGLHGEKNRDIPREPLGSGASSRAHLVMCEYEWRAFFVFAAFLFGRKFFRRFIFSRSECVVASRLTDSRAYIATSTLARSR